MTSILSDKASEATGASSLIAQKVRITADEFGAKYREKSECYHFISHDCGGYLPHYENVTIYHLRDLASGKKKIIKGSDVKHFHVP